MPKFVAGRIIRAAPVVLLISLVVFALIHLAPGGPMTVYLTNPNVLPEDIERLEAALGLDRPLVEQYLRWLGAFVQGDWGFSYVDGRRVSERVLERIPATAQLMLSAFTLAFIGSLLAGTLAATRAGRADQLISWTSLLGISIPTFFLGLVFQLVFAVELGWLPSAGRTRAWSLVLPATTLAFVYWASWTRYIRAAVQQSMGSEFIRAARARGLSAGRILSGYALPNALFPWVTVLSLDLARLVSGAIVTETIFAWPGMGSLLVDSVYRRDYSVLMAILMVGSIFVVAGNLFADVLYAYLDPRVRIGARGQDG